MAASLFFKHKRLMLMLPRQYGGKTELGVRLMRNMTQMPFTSSCLCLAKDHPSLKKMTREKFKRLFDEKDFSVNTESVYLKKFPTSIIYMGSVDKDPDRQRGGTYNMIHWAEVAFSKLEEGVSIDHIWQKVVKPTTEMTDGYALLESTPKGKNGWKDVWDNAKSLRFKTLKVGLDDMVYLGLLSAERYERIESETHPDIFRQEYLVDWVTFQGRVYKEFDEARHVKEIPGPEDWQTTIAAIDWGYNPSATCILFAYVKDDVLHIFDEHYALNELPAITADMIEYKKKIWKINKMALVADHDLARNEELRLRGIECNPADKVDVMGARMQLKELFYFNKVIIDPRCKFLRRDFSAATWHPKKEGELDDTQCTWGHYDGEAASRYLIRELSKVEIEKPIYNPHSDSVSSAAWDMNQRAMEDNINEH